MKDLYEGTLFSAIRPCLFVECLSCPVADVRIEAERALSLAKHGRLDTHEITIECYGDFGHDKVMWARHTGIRYPAEDRRGYRIEDGMISGGEFVDCPGSRPISWRSPAGSLVRTRARKMLDGFNVEAEYEALHARLGWQEPTRRSKESSAQIRAKLWSDLAGRLNQEREVVAFRSFMRRLHGALRCEHCGFESDKAFDWLVIFRLDEGQEVRYDPDLHKLTLQGGEVLRPKSMKMPGMFWTDVTPIHQVAEGHLPTYRTGPEELVNDLFDKCVEVEWLI